MSSTATLTRAIGLTAPTPGTLLTGQLLIALVPTVIFAIYVKTLGRPMFILLLLVMVLLATTELGTDSWIADIMRTVLQSPTLGTLFLVWTSLSGVWIGMAASVGCPPTAC